MLVRNKKPIAVLISDVHYSLKTFQIADVCFRQAIDKAADLNVPLIDCGDLVNDKANLRAEYVNTLIKTFNYALEKNVRIYALIGNHSLIHEKANDHVLHFLAPYCTVVSTPVSVDGFNFIPYQNDSKNFITAIKKFKKGSIVIGHQGTVGGFLGDYVKDSSAFNPDQVKDYKVFLGHYHRHYTLGTTVSIGNPYSLTFGEAEDGPKGFLILNEDGSFDRVYTNQRKHIKLERTLETALETIPAFNRNDFLWLQVTGPASELAKLNKNTVGNVLGIGANFKLDKLPIEITKLEAPKAQRTDVQVIDLLIDQSDESANQKEYMKSYARELLNAS